MAWVLPASELAGYCQGSLRDLFQRCDNEPQSDRSVRPTRVGRLDFECGDVVIGTSGAEARVFFRSACGTTGSRALPDLAPFPTLRPSRPCALPDLVPFPTLRPSRPCALPDLAPFPTLCPSRPCALPDLVPFPTLCSARSRRFRLFVGTQITPVLSRRLPPLLRDEWDAGVDHRVLHARSLSPLVKDAGFRDDAPDV
jgi:hypothetical protein